MFMQVLFQFRLILWRHGSYWLALSVRLSSPRNQQDRSIVKDSLSRTPPSRAVQMYILYVSQASRSVRGIMQFSLIWLFSFSFSPCSRIRTLSKLSEIFAVFYHFSFMNSVSRKPFYWARWNQHVHARPVAYFCWRVRTAYSLNSGARSDPVRSPHHAMTQA